VVCASQQRQIIQAVTLYAADYGGLLPPCIAHCVPNNFWSVSEMLNYAAQNQTCQNDGGAVWRFLGGYLPNIRIFICPMLNDLPSNFASDYQAANTQYLHGSYFLLWNYRGCLASFDPPTRLTDRGNQLLLSDVLYYYNNWAWGTRWVSSHRQASGWFYWKRDERVFWAKDTPVASVPKGIRMNAGYMDGHVESWRSDDAKLVTFSYVPQMNIYFPPKF
jgi:prepilin-type processing-associated H-X9-DG protein